MKNKCGLRGEISHQVELPHCLEDEEQRDERGEDVLGELCEVLDERWSLECSDDEGDDGDPDSDPEAEGEELELLALGEVPQGFVEQEDGTGHTWNEDVVE